MFLQFLPEKKSIYPHSSDQFFFFLFFFDRWHLLTSKLADISPWLGMDSKVTICCNMLHRLRQRPSAFKGHRVARGGINKENATYVGVTASLRGLTQTPAGAAADAQLRSVETVARDRHLTSCGLNEKEPWSLCNSSQACHVCIIKLLLIRSELFVMDCLLINTWLIFEWKSLYCLGDNRFAQVRISAGDVILGADLQIVLSLIANEFFSAWQVRRKKTVGWWRETEGSGSRV